MASELGVTLGAYSAWETGRNTPDLSVYAPKLEALTGIERTWFLGWADEMPPGPNGTGGATSDATPSLSGSQAPPTSSYEVLQLQGAA